MSITSNTLTSQAQHADIRISQKCQILSQVVMQSVRVYRDSYLRLLKERYAYRAFCRNYPARVAESAGVLIKFHFDDRIAVFICDIEFRVIRVERHEARS